MKKLIFGLALTGCMILSTSCTKPEIAVVLEDYCDFKVDQCDLNSPGTSHYSSKKSCDKHHKDMLNNASDGNAKKCSGDIEEFFIALMESQMAGGCNYSFEQSLKEDQTVDTLFTMMQCFKDQGANADINGIIDQIIDPSDDKMALLAAIAEAVAKKNAANSEN